MKKEELIECLEYLKSEEHKEKSKQNILGQIVDYLSNKYPNSSIYLKEDSFVIEGENQLEIIEELKTFQC